MAIKLLFIFLGYFACNGPSMTVNTQEGGKEKTFAGQSGNADTIVPPQYIDGKLMKITKSNDEWKKELTEMEYYVLRQKGTERSFTGDLWNNHEKGTYVCAACGLPLFSSDTKFESGTGWPSFYQPIKPEYIADEKDRSYGMTRDEVLCARCGGHQGHVFDDGPAPTGLRYCINSVSLDFVKQ